MFKFRGKTENGKWIEGDLVIGDRYYIFPRGTLFASMFSFHEKYEVLPESLAISTGLQDKNGVEIFSSFPINGVMSKGGDVLQVPDDYEVYGFMAGEKREIYYKDGCFRLRPNRETDRQRGHTIEDGMEDCQIIGSQFDKEEETK